jgi:hypothetical protein
VSILVNKQSIIHTWLKQLPRPHTYNELLWGLEYNVTLHINSREIRLLCNDRIYIKYIDKYKGWSGECSEYHVKLVLAFYFTRCEIQRKSMKSRSHIFDVKKTWNSHCQSKGSGEEGQESVIYNFHFLLIYVLSWSLFLCKRSHGIHTVNQKDQGRRDRKV